MSKAQNISEGRDTLYTPTPSNSPFIRWAGGKQWLARTIVGFVPDSIGTYFEPFLGGGSVFLNLRPTRSILGDLNQRLIDTYTCIRNNPRDVLFYLSRWKNDPETYSKLRSANFSVSEEKAAQFIYLNKTCWNGLYRVNRNGSFNVPYGQSPERRTHDPTAIMKASTILKNAVLKCCDFEELLKRAQKCDYVYLDPPYTLLHSQNGFRRYNERLFSWEDQERLAKVSTQLCSRGCYVVVSNSFHSDILYLYPQFKCLLISRRSSLAADPKFRKATNELILVSPNFRTQDKPGESDNSI